MKNVEIKVKNCRNCPWMEATWGDRKLQYANCLHPTTTKYKIDSYWKNWKSPEWCELKKEDITISYGK